LPADNSNGHDEPEDVVPLGLYLVSHVT
jgi:hypothetical protein